jgi:hypothetical protein
MLKRRWMVVMLLGTLTNASALLATATDSQCVANVRVTNQRHSAIRVLNLRYKIDGDATVHSDRLENKLVDINETVNWPGQILSAAAPGILISATAIEYQVFNSKGAGEDYGPAHLSPWFNSTIQCGQGYDYVHYIDD